MRVGERGLCEVAVGLSHFLKLLCFICLKVLRFHIRFSLNKRWQYSKISLDFCLHHGLLCCFEDIVAGRFIGTRGSSFVDSWILPHNPTASETLGTCLRIQILNCVIKLYTLRFENHCSVQMPSHVSPRKLFRGLSLSDIHDQ